MSQTIKLSKLKEIIRDLLTKELEEASTTVTAGGSYMTPAAFTAKGKDRRKKNAKQSGYALAEAKFAVKFQLGSEMGDTATIIVNAGSAGAAKMVVAKQLKGGAKKVVSVKRVDAGKAKQIDKKLENVNEGKYHEYRNDKTRTSKQKIGRSMMEVRDKLNELDKLVKMNIKLKNELGVDSTSYWKRTHSAMKKISERLVKLANKVGQLH
jgi:hypothetical protein|tara:strand:+ start:3757 stop:4383 length:627 start_codon:yes stop_codon:yes gene_type:complete